MMFIYAKKKKKGSVYEIIMQASVSGIFNHVYQLQFLN